MDSRRGYYKAHNSGKEVSIHPSGVLHGRNPPPKAVVFTEILVTSKAYVKGVTLVDPAWLAEHEGGGIANT